MKKRVAITGLGAVTPIGNDTSTTWKSLLAGQSGIEHITSFSPDKYSVQIAGTVKNFDVNCYLTDRRLSRHLYNGASFGVAAFVQAMADAKIQPDIYQPHEIGVAIGCGLKWPELQQLSDMLYTMHSSEGKQLPSLAPSDVLLRSHNSGMATMALIGNCQGPMISISTACASSAHAIGEAYRLIQEGEARLMAAGGYDAMTSYFDVLGFSMLGALTTAYNDHPSRGSRPFDRKRSGFVLGEGGVVVILEDWDSALERGADIYGELVGYGSSLNAYRVTDSPPDGGGAILAMANALTESGLRTDEVDYIVAHGTSTPGNDASETVAIKEVFGLDAYRLLVSSPKSMTGHLTAASGALNLLVAACALRDQIVPPTINYEHPDPKLDLNYVPNDAKPTPVRAAMINAFAFGGTNASLVVRHANFQEVQS